METMGDTDCGFSYIKKYLQTPAPSHIMLYVLLKYGIYVGIQLIITIMVTMQSIIIAYSALVMLISYPFLIPRKYIIYITGKVKLFRNLLMSKQEEKRTLDFLSYKKKIKRLFQYL